MDIHKRSRIQELEGYWMLSVGSAKVAEGFPGNPIKLAQSTLRPWTSICAPESIQDLATILPKPIPVKKEQVGNTRCTHLLYGQKDLLDQIKNLSLLANMIKRDVLFIYQDGRRKFELKGGGGGGGRGQKAPSNYKCVWSSYKDCFQSETCALLVHYPIFLWFQGLFIYTTLYPTSDKYYTVSPKSLVHFYVVNIHYSRQQKKPQKSQCFSCQPLSVEGGGAGKGLATQKKEFKLKKFSKKNVATILSSRVWGDKALVAGPLKNKLFCGFPKYEFCYKHCFFIFCFFFPRALYIIAIYNMVLIKPLRYKHEF